MDGKYHPEEIEYYERLWNLWKNGECFSDFPVLENSGLAKETIDNILLSLNLSNKSSLNKKEFYKLIENININLIEKGRNNNNSDSFPSINLSQKIENKNGVF
jgi:hypothetical protein